MLQAVGRNSLGRHHAVMRSVANEAGSVSHLENAYYHVIVTRIGDHLGLELSAKSYTTRTYQLPWWRYYYLAAKLKSIPALANIEDRADTKCLDEAELRLTVPYGALIYNLGLNPRDENWPPGFDPSHSQSI